jgi:hypothetical protein
MLQVLHLILTRPGEPSIIQDVDEADWSQTTKHRCVVC